MFKKIIKNSPLYLFYAFLFTIPFQKRHIFNLETAKINNVFAEWQAIAVYLSDILLLICFLFWLVNIIFFKKQHQQKVDKLYYILAIAIFLFSVISILLNYNNYLDQSIAIYKILKLAEFILLFIFILKNINTKRIIIISLSVLSISGVISSIIAMIQYLKQGTIGLKMLGEPLVFPILPNVAKLVLDNGNIVMRAYGTFPHPNILAGFLLATIICSLALIVYLINKGLDKPKYRLLTISVSFGLILQIFAFIFSFSRTAWTGLFIALILFCILNRKNIQKALKYIYESSFYHIVVIVILATMFIIVSQWPQITSRAAIFDQHGDRAVSNRAFYNNISFEMIKKNPIVGIGYDNFATQLQNFTSQKIELWQYQPAHNIYLLIFAESGIFALLSFLALIIVASYKLKIMNSMFNFAAFSILIAFLFIALFDHYLWTIQQGQLLFWLVLGLTATKIDQQKIEG